MTSPLATADTHQDQQFLEMIVKAIVKKPELARVERTVDTFGVLLMIHVDPSDMGYVIGRRGQMAVAIRTVLKGLVAKTDMSVNMKIYEPEDSRRAFQESRGQARERAAPLPKEVPHLHGAARLVTDEDLSDLGI